MKNSILSNYSFVLNTLKYIGILGKPCLSIKDKLIVKKYALLFAKIENMEKSGNNPIDKNNGIYDLGEYFELKKIFFDDKIKSINLMAQLTNCKNTSEVKNCIETLKYVAEELNEKIKMQKQVKDYPKSHVLIRKSNVK